MLAAFTAAGLSLVSAISTVRLSGRSRLGQWRREAALPAVANLMRLTDQSFPVWESLAFVSGRLMEAGDDDADRPGLRAVLDRERSAAVAHLELVILEAAKVELLGGPHLRTAAQRVVSTQETMRHRLREGGGDDKWRAFAEVGNELGARRTDLIASARRDLGI